MSKSPPGSSLSLATASTTLPSRRVAFHSSGSCSVVESTNLGRLIIRSLNGSPERSGQEATNSSYGSGLRKGCSTTGLSSGVASTRDRRRHTPTTSRRWRRLEIVQRREDASNSPLYCSALGAQELRP